MDNQRTRIAIVGATSSIAEHCARIWAGSRNLDLTLVCRDGPKAERMAADLRVRCPGSAVQVVEADFLDPTAVHRLVHDLTAQGPIDIALIAHGYLPDQLRCQEELTATHHALVINGISPVLFAEAFANHMARINHGTLCIIGSVAGDRGRRSNYVYGAAKGLITRYAQGLQHRLANTNVKVVLVKPGPTATPMTAHMNQRGMASAADVAQCVVDGIGKGKPLVYAPAKWGPIMMAIRHLPGLIFNRMNI